MILIMLRTLKRIRGSHGQGWLGRTQTQGPGIEPNPGHLLYSPPHPTPGSRAALTVCYGTAIRHASQINSWPVQENCQLTARDNTAFVLRLQVQGQLCVLHCWTQKATWVEESKCTQS